MESTELLRKQRENKKDTAIGSFIKRMAPTIRAQHAELGEAWVVRMADVHHRPNEDAQLTLALHE